MRGIIQRTWSIKTTYTIVFALAIVALVLVFGVLFSRNLDSNIINDMNNSSHKDSNTIVELSGVVPQVTFDDLVQQSCLVVNGKVTDKTETKLIQSVASSSDPVCFTDIEIAISEIYRGKTDDDHITIRIMGGSKGKYEYIVSDEPTLNPGDDVILFLYKPTSGGGWTTQEDYYLVIGAHQGVFYRGVDCYYYNKSLNLEKLDPSILRQQMQIMNEQIPIDYDFHMNYVLNSLESNYQRGIITEEQYYQFLEQMTQYATIID
ncbi:MAG: hypothetical protein LBU61_04530 [Coriobacteriales bacterium]|jgi:hypothetical protein|nr:hypothetical protein [Coriobacteriales bacterium]